MSIYLTITAHPDDEILGFGGSSYHLSKKGHKIFNCILSGNVEERKFRPEINKLKKDIDNAQKIVGAEQAILGNFPNIKFNTVPHIDLVQFIERAIIQTKPDYIFTHHPEDLNNDHYHTSKACQAAARLYQRRPMKKLKGLYFMEIPSSTDWSFSSPAINFSPDTFITIGKVGLNKKIRALNAYKGIMRSYPHPRSPESIEGLSIIRGSQVGRKYCESFQTAMNIID
jgi:LmbE family N-acetylglucosaminyl deacetylase|tara:strand:+ start:1691 stop:2371 length:681 start_codon:yes stop_codon:yes gene_type:complete